MDWDAAHDAGTEDRLMGLLEKLPHTRWAERDGSGGRTLLHCACQGTNVTAVVALLKSGLVDVNARDHDGLTALHCAAIWEQTRALEVLCAVGADMKAYDAFRESVLASALRALDDSGNDAGARVLIANGLRLGPVREECRQNKLLAWRRTLRCGADEDCGHRITPELEAFERGVLCCRAAVVALLRVKRSGKLVRWDKYLLEELAVGVWSTRYDKKWQK